MSVVVQHFGPGAVRRGSERRTFGPRARKIGLGVFFASVVVNAAIGIYAVLMPDFGETAEKILLTSLCVTGAVLMALCCEPAWERRLLGQVPAVGALLGAAAFAGLIVGIWTETNNETLANLLWSTFAIALACTAASLVVLERVRTGISAAHQGVLSAALALLALGAAAAVVVIWSEAAGETVGKIASSGQMIAVACVLGAFLTLARLAPSHQWVLGVTLGLLMLGTAMIVEEIWREGGGGALTRVMGVVLIVLAAFAVSVPVLHWVDRGALAVSEASADAVRFCPHCGSKLAGEIGVELECGRCGRGFTIAATEPDGGSSVNLT